jgi:mono/diheme cytochrome c family protein
MPQFGSQFPRLAVAAGLAAGLLFQGSLAQADEVGRQEYMYSCSACHGDSGRGDGPVARFLNVETPSLTTLAQQNNGDFPLLHVIQVIDGRSGVGPHGTIMPVWGARFMASEIDDAGRYGAEVIVRGRILSIARYLESIQE